MTRPDPKDKGPLNPDGKHFGWPFATPKDVFSNGLGNGALQVSDIAADPNEGAKFIRDLYDKCNDTVGIYSVPILWDKKNRTIVNNESSELIRILNGEFNDVAGKADLDLAPKSLLKAMKAVDEWIYPNINNGVYRCGFAKS